MKHEVKDQSKQSKATKPPDVAQYALRKGMVARQNAGYRIAEPCSLSVGLT